MHLNQLYGYFGRSTQLIQTVNVLNENLYLYASTRSIKAFIPVTENVTTLLMHTNLNNDLINKLNIQINGSIENNFTSVKSNVAIAAAVTSYARIVMNPYKILEGTCYTDTDSIFTDTPLDSSLIYKELGFMKDELDGKIISEAVFIDIKKYGYKYSDNNQIIERSVIAGVPRDTISFQEVLDIFKGKIISKIIHNRFHKSFTDLSISIQSDNLTIKNNYNKVLVDNHYLPLHLNLLPNDSIIKNQILKIVNQIKKFRKYIY